MAYATSGNDVLPVYAGSHLSILDIRYLWIKGTTTTDRSRDSCTKSAESEGIRWMLRNAITNFTGFAPLGMVLIAMFGIGVAQHSGFIDACVRQGVKNRKIPRGSSCG